MNKLYLKNYEHPEGISLRDFLFDFFTTANEEHYTMEITKDGEHKIQCSPGKIRSLGDIHRICTTYYDGVTRKQVKEELLNFKKDLVGHYCPDIHKRVYSLKAVHPDWCQECSCGNDEYGDPITYRNE
ncbi:MAG: hypothetical protein ACOCUD_02885 [Bacillota bacterium]